ncbi:LuxR family transcriptional regulator [Pseudomonas sp. Irchel 3A5]|jgi:DNA-binding CsgD family transcriptional regulator|uniref:helix-turn-helix transcriptional regulator n=1 Tax=Pseudomonas sp. Irchel 3A5 TaxID=2008911 RepID=UPI000BA2BCD9|nr:LuxR family transcriptional regulator [Pseudomonas sp. Irchel 3A5]
MGSAESINSNENPLIQQMVRSIHELDSNQAIENALDWLRQECQCEGAIFCQFRGSMLLTLVTSNIDRTWSQHYRRQLLLMDDPVVNHYREQLGFIDWKAAFKRYPPTDSFMQHVEKHALTPACSYGYTSPARSFQGVTSICSLNGLSRPLKAPDMYLLSSLVPVLHLVGRGTKLRSRGLSDKEVEILEWARDGKTAWEIATIRQVSEATVKYHFRSIYSKLGVSNRAQAVGEALCQGIIK